ncbi:MAG TPA: helix-turn-helix domain-containing protein [Thermomicrobiales bacterium]|nr:helix-turn-helix domain-containing protein [Thermomicrobiales bacterium]
MIDFAPLLTELRTARGWTQKQLAQAAQLDQSYISRLEAGTRMPEHPTTLKLADALDLSPIERERLLAAGGFRSEAWDDPLLRDLISLLLDPALPAQTKEDVRTLLRVAVEHGHRAQEEPRS